MLFFFFSVLFPLFEAPSSFSLWFTSRKDVKLSVLIPKMRKANPFGGTGSVIKSCQYSEKEEVRRMIGECPQFGINNLHELPTHRHLLTILTPFVSPRSPSKSTNRKTINGTYIYTSIECCGAGTWISNEGRCRDREEGRREIWCPPYCACASTPIIHM